MEARGWWKNPGLIICGLIVLGLSLRAYHYLRDPAVWHDEAALIVNVLPLGFGQLLGPLRHAEAAPPLFLWLERATFLVFGDSAMALRLPPFLASVITLGVVAWTARRELGSKAAVWAVLLVASSDRLLWHSCEAKPYAFDVLSAAVLLTLFSATGDWSVSRRTWAFLPLMPLVVWVSYPGCFLCGGLLLGLFPAAWRDRRPAAILSFAILALAIAGSFVLMYFGPARAQRCAAMDSCWTAQFPDWSRPWTVPIWSIASTFDAARYCFMPWGYPLAVFAAVGSTFLWRSRRRDFVIMAAAPIGLNLLAAWVHGYPYGGARVVVHAAPALAILAAAGIAPCVDWLRSRNSALAIPLAIFLMMPLGLSISRVAVPWFRADNLEAASYVLTRRSADEPVIGNHWEYEYYCRRIGDHFSYLDENNSLPSGRTWVVLTAFDASDRQTLIARICRQRRIVEQRDFVGTSALLLDAASPTDGMKAGEMTRSTATEQPLGGQ